MKQNEHQDVWSLVGVDFDEKLPRRTAVAIKHDDWDLPFAYPTDFGKVGYQIDTEKVSGYNEASAISLSFAEYTVNRIYGTPNLQKSQFFFKNMRSCPSVIEREIESPDTLFSVDETFSQASDTGFTWNLRCKNLHRWDSPFRSDVFTIVTVPIKGCTVTSSDNTVTIKYEGGTIHITSNHDKVAVYRHLEGFLEDAASGKIGEGDGEGRYVVFHHLLEMERGQEQTVRFGIHLEDPEKARSAFEQDPPIGKIRQKWNEWFASLSAPHFDSEDEMKAYYKCWWVVRLNYYQHPEWGKTVLEAFPVYRGYWQWGLTAMETISRYNREIGETYIKNLLDLFLKYQREDGYVTHAIHLDEEVPGEGWSKLNLVQTPHVPWLAVRYFNNTGDVDSLRQWYPGLKRYYDFLVRQRDKNYRDLHMWAIKASYDTGLDTTSAFDRVTYNEDGLKESHCYPAIFAAERARYEQAMAKIAAVIENGEEDFWKVQAEETVAAMNEHLWDGSKKWYGVLHEDGTLDTRVGVDGLFALAYGLVEKDKAGSMKDNFCKLIAPFGVRTMAPDEKDYAAGVYWRGPSWPKSMAMAGAAATKYYPDLVDAIHQGAVRFALRYPSIWECMNATTGEIGKADVGLIATPMISSNVGAGELIGLFIHLGGHDMLEL
ncbi:MAG: hypothetical protein ABFD64_01410 [Armatimonadota bacterium]